MDYKYAPNLIFEYNIFLCNNSIILYILITCLGILSIYNKEEGKSSNYFNFNGVLTTLFRLHFFRACIISLNFYGSSLKERL
jgi:hypothetical protein